MKNTFKEYFYPQESDYDEVWNDSLIVFDTSSLLNLYLYTKSSRKQYFDVMEHYKDRLWLPYQVGLEFNRNRIRKIKEAQDLYDELGKAVEDQINKFRGAISAIFKVKDSYHNDILKIIDKDKEKILKKLDDRKSVHIDFKSSMDEDTILTKIIDLYDGKVGEDLKDETLQKINSEGKMRFEQSIPPGYCDVDKKDSKRRMYGDLIVWKQIMEKATKENKDIIFITDDRKEDWWWIMKGQTISPRVELYKEFMDETSQRILIYKPDRFLDYAKSKTAVKVDDKTIKEIRSTRFKPIYAYTLDSLDIQERKELRDLLSRYKKGEGDFLTASDYLDSFSKDNYTPLELWERIKALESLNTLAHSLKQENDKGDDVILLDNIES